MSSNLLPSIFIALFCVAFVVAEQHVEIVWADPATYVNFLRHKCGLMMLSSFVWVGFELVRSAFFPSRQPVRKLDFGMRLISGGRLLQ